MFSAKRKKESKSEIPQWKLDMLAAESGGSAPSSETVSADALADAPIEVAARDLGAVIVTHHAKPEVDVLSWPNGRLVIIKGWHRLPPLLERFSFLL